MSYKRKTGVEKGRAIKRLAIEEGFDSLEDFLDLKCSDSVCIGICDAAGCDGENHNVEPDARNYRCEECGNYSISSIPVMLNLI